MEFKREWICNLNTCNSILADSALATDTSFSGDYNLLGFTNDITGGANDITDVSDAMLGPLTDNGGSTLTHSLMAGSPALNSDEEAEQFILGDVYCDGVVNLLDVAPFVDLVSNGGFSEADISEDGAVNLLGVQPLVSLLSGG